MGIVGCQGTYTVCCVGWSTIHLVIELAQYEQPLRFLQTSRVGTATSEISHQEQKPGIIDPGRHRSYTPRATPSQLIERTYITILRNIESDCGGGTTKIVGEFCVKIRYLCEIRLSTATSDARCEGAAQDFEAPQPLG